MSFSLRSATPADVPEIHELNRRIEVGDRIPIVTPLEEFMDWNDDPYYDELLRPLGQVDSIPTIPGIELRPWDHNRSEELRVVDNRAFADHWGSTPIDQKAWNHRLESVGIRTDMSWMAVDGDRIVSLSLNAHYPGDVEVTGRKDGWVMSLGTEPDYRKLRSGWTVRIPPGRTGFMSGSVSVRCTAPCNIRWRSRSES